MQGWPHSLWRLHRNPDLWFLLCPAFPAGVSWIFAGDTYSEGSCRQGRLSCGITGESLLEWEDLLWTFAPHCQIAQCTDSGLTALMQCGGADLLLLNLAKAASHSGEEYTPESPQLACLLNIQYSFGWKRSPWVRRLSCSQPDLFLGFWNTDLFLPLH